ncbi:MAG TPA: cytochrome c-type biogenesis protein CcmH [Solirubrobacterales bacterium]
MTRRSAWALIALLLAVAAAPTGVVAQQVTLADLEDEVMCPICGTLLELSNAPQAERERALIERLIAEGETKAEIKDALVVQYGSEVLALPEGSGFNLSAYLVPAIGFVLAAVALAIGVARWRRAGGRRSGPEQPADGGPKGEEAERLDADLARYDL